LLIKFEFSLRSGSPPPVGTVTVSGGPDDW
jgi:hypothetical protein